MSVVAGRNAWLANMAALGAGGGCSGEPAQTADNQGMAENLQLLSAAYMYLCIHDILYMHDIHVHVYIHIYIHTYIYIYIYI